MNWDDAGLLKLANFLLRNAGSIGETLGVPQSLFVLFARFGQVLRFEQCVADGFQVSCGMDVEKNDLRRIRKKYQVTNIFLWIPYTSTLYLYLLPTFAYHVMQPGNNKNYENNTIRASSLTNLSWINHKWEKSHKKSIRLREAWGLLTGRLAFTRGPIPYLTRDFDDFWLVSEIMVAIFGPTAVLVPGTIVDRGSVLRKSQWIRFARLRLQSVCARVCMCLCINMHTWVWKYKEAYLLL